MSDQTEITIKLTVDEEQLDTLRLYQPSDARPVEEELEEAAATIEALAAKLEAADNGKS